MSIVTRRIMDTPQETAWMDDPGIRCKNKTELFYPDRPASDVAKAKATCNGNDGGPICPRRKDCAHYAIDHHEKHGVWGGMSERDRRKIQRARKLRRSTTIYSLEDIRFSGQQIVVRRRVNLKLLTYADAQKPTQPNVSRPNKADKSSSPTFTVAKRNRRAKSGRSSSV